ncbi:RNA-binding protein 39-like isoform X2 [Dreissena polymorpha]|uniref:RNA-binding protein 39-like isoform X2 n=1 Tax=Dreissena polymorpha TaxID=45954 RepID=UPI002264C8C6|nr:RNA-binding protein 39-like isoform X2 [Dreissena polymorpha]
MADEFDVEAMLEAPYRKEDEGRGDASTEKERKSSSSRRRSRSRDKDRKKDKEKRRSKDRDRERKRSKDRDGKRSSKSDKKRSRSRDKDKEKKRSRSRDRKDRDRKRSRSRDRKRKSRSPRRGGRRSISKSPVREPPAELTPEERDARTVFCMQLSARIRPRDLEEFFSSVGEIKDCFLQIKDVRLITDNKTRRSKGIAYIEFKDTESVPLAIGLTNQKLLGVPIIVQASQAEKNRSQMAANIIAKTQVTGPMRLYVGSLHFNITEDMLKGIFEPFGKIEDIKLIRDHETGKSHGYGFITYKNAEDAKKALEQLNGFELAGRPMKVGNVTERQMDMQTGGQLDNDELDRAGIDLGATGRLALMAKLAEGTGFELPDYAKNSLQMQGLGTQLIPGMPTPMVKPQVPAATASAPPIATQCFMLSNMFDPTIESKLSWDQEIRDDVIEECSKHGGVLHLYVDKASPQGNVYVKCPTIAAAVASVNSLHGRYFGGKIIQAAYVPLPNYHALFPESQRASQLLYPSTQTLGMSGFAQQPSIFNGMVR